MQIIRDSHTPSSAAIKSSAILAALAFCWLWGVGDCWPDATLDQKVDPPTIHLGETAQVSITVTDGGWTRLLQLPKVDGLTVIRLGHEEAEGTWEHPIVISRFSASVVSHKRLVLFCFLERGREHPGMIASKVCRQR